MQPESKSEPDPATDDTTAAPPPGLRRPSTLADVIVILDAAGRMIDDLTARVAELERARS